MKLNTMRLAFLLALVFSASIGHAYTVTVTASPANIPANGNAVAELQALVKDGNNPVQGVVVNWTKETTESLGALLDSTDTTDANGIAKTRLRAPINIGTTKVIATTSGNDTGNFTVKFSGVATQIQFDAMRENYYLPADGSSSAIISATVRDSDGNAVFDGTQVECSITSGSVTSPIYTIGGRVMAKVTSASTPGHEVLHLSVGDVSSEISVGYTSTTYSGIAISSLKKSIPNDGSAQTYILASVVDDHGNALRDGAIVSFSTDAGTITASAPVLAGEAIVPLTSGTTATKATVTASYSGSSTNKEVWFGAGVDTIMVYPRHATIGAGTDSAVKIEAIVADIDGNPVPDGTLVTFTTDKGTIDAKGVCDGGVASATMFAGTTLGVAAITATCGSVSANGQLIIAGNPATITVVPMMSSIFADGTSCNRIKVIAVDTNGNPVPDGTVLNVSATSGVVTGRVTTYVGIAEFPLLSSSTSGTSQLSVTYGTVTGTASVVLAGAATSITAIAYPTALPADGLATAMVNADVRDGNANPVADGTVVTFTTNNGAVTATSTTMNGKATARFTASNSAATAVVTASCGTFQTQVSISCQ